MISSGTHSSSVQLPGWRGYQGITLLLPRGKHPARGRVLPRPRGRLPPWPRSDSISCSNAPAPAPCWTRRVNVSLGMRYMTKQTSPLLRALRRCVTSATAIQGWMMNVSPAKSRYINRGYKEIATCCATGNFSPCNGMFASNTCSVARIGLMCTVFTFLPLPAPHPLSSSSPPSFLSPLFFICKSRTCSCFPSYVLRTV